MNEKTGLRRDFKTHFYFWINFELFFYSNHSFWIKISFIFVMCITLYPKFAEGEIVCANDSGLHLRRIKINPNNVCKSVSLNDTQSQQRTLPKSYN